MYKTVAYMRDQQEHSVQACKDTFMCTHTYITPTRMHTYIHHTDTNTCVHQDTNNINLTCMYT
jgi:hypothetical protein